MGPPSAGGSGQSFRFLPVEVTALEKLLDESKGITPTRKSLQALADMFSNSPERKGKGLVHWKQISTWFQHKRYAVKKSSKVSETHAVDTKTDALVATRDVASTAIQTGESTFLKVQAAKPVKMEFEARSCRDGAWYDVDSFLAHRMVDSSDPEVRVRFSGFGAEEDEWVNVRCAVRERSLPCEASDCVTILPGDVVLCFQERNDQALYYDACVKEVERRRHDVRGCRCRFLIQYEHDGYTEIVPLRKLCRRPERERSGHSGDWKTTGDANTLGTESDVHQLENPSLQ